MNQIKTFYNYELIKQKLNSNYEVKSIFNENNNSKSSFVPLKLKNIYKLINNIPIQDFNNNNKDKVFEFNFNFSPNIQQVKNQQYPNLFISVDFEIISKEMVKLFEKDNNILIETKFTKCIIGKNYIIINFPKDENINKYITIVGKLYDSIFKTEYILLYEHSYERDEHIEKNKYNLNAILNNVNDENLFIPIIDKYINNKEEVICQILKYNSNSNGNYIPINDEINNEELKDNFYGHEIGNNNNDDKEFKNDIDISEYNLDFNPHSPHIKDNFSKSPTIGLQNIGATCYMNATLQCFCHIEKFIDEFKYSDNIIKKVRNNKNNLTGSFKLLIEKLWPNNYGFNNQQKDYAPNEFKTRISAMNPLFKGVAANDAKDLVNFIIMTLHEELNEANHINNNNNIFLDQRNQQVMFSSFVENFKNSNKSIISDLFYAINCNITQCGGCGVQTFNYQTYFFIVFPLEEVRKFKLSNYNNQIMNFNYNNVVDIYECFEYDKKINIMSGANAMYCNYCKQTCQSSMCTVLTTGPQILILLLNRGKGIEFDVKINFYEDLNLFNYIQMNNTGFNYKLIGVITHIGESGMGGHFIAYCRGPIYNGWYKYNDSIVTPVINFQSEVINFAMPYLLFYQKM